MNNIKFLLLFLTCFCSYGCSEDSSSINDEISESDYTILFIGNNLTYTNDLPKLVEEKAKEKGITVKTKIIAFPNYAI